MPPAKRITNLSEKVYKIVKEIPKGKLTTYKDVAFNLGNPKLARAVGNALNKNNNPKIPCHRVIRSDGKIGGFNKGKKNKILLLKKEGVLLKNKKPQYFL